MLLAREIAPNDFGVVATFVSIATVVGAVADLGLETTVLRRGSTGGDDITRPARLHQVTVGAACLGLLIVGLVLAVGPYPELYPLLPTVAWVWLERRMNLFAGLLLARGHPGRAGVALGGARLASVVTFVLLLHALDSPVLAYSLASVLGSLGGLLVARDPLPPPRGDEGLGRLLRRANPFWQASMSGLLRTLDVPLVQAFAGPPAAAVYALPSRAVAPLRLLATTMSTTAIPYASQRDSARLRELERTTLLGWLAMMGILVVSWSFIDNLVVLVLGDAYAAAAQVLRILAIGVVVNVPGAYWSGVLQGTGHERLVARVGAVLVVVFAGLVTCGALIGGASGAAVGVVMMYAIQTLIFGWRRARLESW